MAEAPAPGSQSINDLNNLRGLAKKVYGAVPKDAEKRKKRKFKIFESK
jgi:hypothetical protein